MEFDRMGKNISSMKTVFFFSPPLSSLSEDSSLQVFGKVFITNEAASKSNTRGNSRRPGKAFVPKKSNATAKFSAIQYTVEGRQTERRTKKHRPISARHGNTHNLIKRKQWGLNDPIRRRLEVTRGREGTEFPGDAWRGMIIEKKRGERKGREKAGGRVGK